MAAGPDFAVLDINVDGQIVHVLLAPERFVTEQRLLLPIGTDVMVIGIPGLRWNGEPAMIARTVTAGSKTFALRRETGEPAWQ